MNNQLVHIAEKEMKIAQAEAKRFPSSLQKAQEAEINYYKAKENERKNEEISKDIWGF